MPVRIQIVEGLLLHSSCHISSVLAACFVYIRFGFCWPLCTFINYIYLLTFLCITLPSVLWHCWLGGRKGIRPVKNWVVGCWRGYLSGARCRRAQLMPLPLTVSCFSKIQICFTFLVPAHLGSPRKGPLNGCVCVLLSYVIVPFCRCLPALVFSHS